jgi:diguanylate cyclase (GGDEF)-like protein
MRSRLDAVLRETISNPASAAGGIALAMLDIDRFAPINEEFGTEAGERVLQTLAAILTEEVPGSAYRISGDEFAVALIGVTLEQAFLRMDKLRARVAEQAAQRMDLPNHQEVTVTIGVAQYPRDARDIPGLYRAADAALMSAKEQGRNVVALPLNEEMVMKSCYYPSTGVRKLKALAERLQTKESVLLREALSDLLRKYDTA